MAWQRWPSWKPPWTPKRGYCPSPRCAGEAGRKLSGWGSKGEGVAVIRSVAVPRQAPFL